VELQHFRCFCATATLFSVTKAAEQLGMTQSNVSHHIATLEARFKTSLFDRTSNGMQLTEAGRKLLPHALNIMEELNAIDQKLVPK